MPAQPTTAALAVPKPSRRAKPGQPATRRRRPAHDHAGCRECDRTLVCRTCGTHYSGSLALFWRSYPLQPGEPCTDRSWSQGREQCSGRLELAPKPGDGSAWRAAQLLGCRAN
jgi:hypothetical protein